MGSGPVLVIPPGGLTHLEWYAADTEAHEKFCSRLAEHRTLVLYDRHGCGLSDRNRTDFTFEDDMKDLEAVIEAVAAPEVEFFGISWGGAPTLAYSARYPERVKRIVLYGTGSAGRAAPSKESLAREESLAALRRADWDLYHKTRALQFFPSGLDPDTFVSFGRMLQDSATPEMVEQLDGVHAETQSLLSGITLPALVIHRRGDQVARFEWGRYLARRLPNARFVPLDGDVHFPWVGDADSVLNPTIEFLTADDHPDTSVTTLRGLQTILFTDLEASTQLTQRLGDEGAQELLRGHNVVVRAALDEHGGREVKHTGDGIMASFHSAVSAVKAALVMQRELAGGEVRVRIGLNAGEPLAEGDDLFGVSVIKAARIGDRAEPGQVLVSDVVRQLCEGKTFVFTSVGDAMLKGFEEPVALYEVTA